MLIGSVTTYNCTKTHPSRIFIKSILYTYICICTKLSKKKQSHNKCYQTHFLFMPIHPFILKVINHERGRRKRSQLLLSYEYSD